MSLLVDHDHVTLSDLCVLDSEIPDIVNNNGITVEGENGIIRESWGECANKLTENMQMFGSDTFFHSDPVAGLHGGFGTNRTRICLEQIVVEKNSPLKRWMTYSALALVYRAAVRRMIQDRFEAKLDLAREDLKEKWRTLARSGLPIVYSPLPCPGAVHVSSAGTFGESNVSVLPGSGLDGAYDIAITWVTRSGVESGPSVLLTQSTTATEVLDVNIYGLTPPSEATSWLIYACPSGEVPTLKAVVPIGTNSSTLPGAPGPGGQRVGNGQKAFTTLSFQQIFQRA